MPSCVVHFSFWSPSLICLHLCVLSLELLNQDLQKGILKLNITLYELIKLYLFLNLISITGMAYMYVM